MLNYYICEEKENKVVERKCRGCGALLQIIDADKFGYIPENQYTQGSQLCRRCFRINHYGKDEIGPVQADRSLDEINMGIRWSTGVVLVVDILDFEAGLPHELLELIGKKDVVLALNKIDLVPDETSLEELKRWAEGRLSEFNLSAPKFILVSADTGHGFQQLANEIRFLGKKVLFMGVTNVGKSSVLQRLIKMPIFGGQKQKNEPTVSPYPGTTVGMSHWEFPRGLILADSPGYVPQGRISDLVSPELAAKIIPHKKLTSHLYPIKPDDLILIPGLCAIECIESKDEGVLLAFTGSGVAWQKSTTKHLEKWLQKDSEISSWEQSFIELQPREDLTISGLGWVSARKSAYKLNVHLPTGVKLFTRPNLIGRKK